MVKKLLALIITVCSIHICMPYCGKAEENGNTPGGRYEGPYSELNGTYGGIDSLGRELPSDTDVSDIRKEKTAGIFYFLWHGEHGTGGPYDNSKIVTAHPDAIESEQKWLDCGGGPLNAMSYWGEPLFGYYVSSDKWVLRKHLQMLTDAGIDYIVIDTTNAITYINRVKDLIEVWYEYLEKGYDVPKITFYTNTRSGSTIMKLYKNIYSSEALNTIYPRLSELWFRWDGKPLIIGVSSDTEITDEARGYFRIKESVWPNGKRTDDGFPWMEFDRMFTGSAVYGLNGRKEVVNISLAQHSDTCRMSYTAWYGSEDRTRSWHDGSNDTAEDAVYYGYNAAEQWEWALAEDPETVFITGWNEWTAQRQPAEKDHPIVFVDNAEPNTSRDAEPMHGLFGDNYYIQLIDHLRRFKGTARRVYIGSSQTIDISGDFSQWEAGSITARYTDYENDTAARNSRGYGYIRYTDTTGRNDIILARAAYDADHIYFFAETADTITPRTDDCWMTLFISSGKADTARWAGMFDYAVNLEKPDGDTVIISAFNKNGSWAEAGRGQMKLEGNRIMLSVPRSILKIGQNDLIDIEFKWADNYQKDENGCPDIFSFYTHGDAAPMGRLTYIFSEVQ